MLLKDMFRLKPKAKYVVRSKLDPVWFDTRTDARLLKKALKKATNDTRPKIYTFTTDGKGYEDYREIS